MYTKILIFEKKNLFTSWIRTRDLLNASQLLYPLSHMAVVFDGMLLHFFRLQPAVEHNLITALTHGNKLEVGRLWVSDVMQLICRCWQFQRVNGMTDRQTDGFSYR